MKLIEEAQLAEFNRFLSKLRGINEGSSTLLKNTAVLFGSNLGNASSHNCTNLPIIVAGGGFRHGQHFDMEHKQPLCNLYLSVLQRLGCEVDRFNTSTGTLAELV